MLGSKPRLTEANDFQMYTCRYLAWRSALVGLGQEQWNEEDQLFAIEISNVSSTNSPLSPLNNRKIPQNLT